MARSTRAAAAAAERRRRCCFAMPLPRWTAHRRCCWHYSRFRLPDHCLITAHTQVDTKQVCMTVPDAPSAVDITQEGLDLDFHVAPPRFTGGANISELVSLVCSMYVLHVGCSPRRAAPVHWRRQHQWSCCLCKFRSHPRLDLHVMQPRLLLLIADYCVGRDGGRAVRRQLRGRCVPSRATSVPHAAPRCPSSPCSLAALTGFRLLATSLDGYGSVNKVGSSLGSELLGSEAVRHEGGKGGGCLVVFACACAIAGCIPGSRRGARACALHLRPARIPALEIQLAVRPRCSRRRNAHTHT